MWSIREAVYQIVYHCKILIRGLSKTLYGTGVAGLLFLAAYGFTSIPSEGGYVAVCEFIGSMATLVIALNGMYAFGARKKKNGRFSPYE